MTENEKLDIILEKLSSIDGRVRDIEVTLEKLSDIDGRVRDIEVTLEKLSDIDGKVRGIEITLENETNRNINLIAEGHLNLDIMRTFLLCELRPVF